MVEYKDASEAERAVDLCNSGLMAVRAADLWPLLARVGNDNAAGEYYLPDIVMLAAADGRAIGGDRGRAGEVDGDQQPRRARRGRGRLAARGAAAEAMADGVTLIAPETVWFAHDTEDRPRYDRSSPTSSSAPASRSARASGSAPSAISRARRSRPAPRSAPMRGCGPAPRSARAPRSAISSRSRRRRLGKGAKANHLSYLGDAEVGAGANIGAGTITCNYDGYLQISHRRSARAPSSARTARWSRRSRSARARSSRAGSVITRDVAADALALARGEQVEKPGCAARLPRDR